MLGNAERRTAVYTLVHEDSSTASTTQFAATVEFGKKSIHLSGFTPAGAASATAVDTKANVTATAGGPEKIPQSKFIKPRDKGYFLRNGSSQVKLGTFEQI